MANLYIIAEDRTVADELCRSLTDMGYACSAAPDADEMPADADMVLVEAGYARVGDISRKVKRGRNVPVIALLNDVPDDVGGNLDSVDDFAVKPWDLKELDLRIKRQVRKTSRADSGEVVGCGDIVIDVAAYEVFVGGRPVELTFKEYELLRFMVTNCDRVFTRETLLNKVWGYDYYGGDRTIDVHIQRLRGKIEGSKNVLIETVRNIGYRLRVEPAGAA